jgi:hypothetical protein
MLVQADASQVAGIGHFAFMEAPAMTEHDREVQQLVEDMRAMVNQANSLLARTGSQLRFNPEPFDSGQPAGVAENFHATDPALVELEVGVSPPPRNSNVDNGSTDPPWNIDSDLQRFGEAPTVVAEV